MPGRFGITVAWQGSTIDGLTAMAEEAEKLGYGYFWIPEAWGLEAFSASSYLIARTNRIRIGTGVVNVFSRSAALIGMACATIDQMSPGRFMLGLGSSGRGVIENWHGFRFERPLKRTEEYLEVIKKVSRGDTLEYNGETVRGLSRFRLYTKPMSSDPEINLGAIGEENLKLAGRIAQGAILATYPISKLVFAARCVMEGGAGGGKHDSGEDQKRMRKLFSYYPTFVCVDGTSKDQEYKARESVRRNIAFYLSSMGSYYAKNHTKLGFGEDVKRIVEEHRRKGSDGARFAVSERLVSELALIGSASEIKEKVAKVVPQDVVTVFGLSASSPEDITTSLRSMNMLLG